MPRIPQIFHLQPSRSYKNFPGEKPRTPAYGEENGGGHRVEGSYFKGREWAEIREGGEGEKNGRVSPLLQILYVFSVLHFQCFSHRHNGLDTSDDSSFGYRVAKTKLEKKYCN